MLNSNTLIQNRYLIMQRIGQGGMGAVYEAVDQRLGSTVALKQMTITGQQAQQGFEREARILARLRHPALPKVFDYFSDPAGQFLVMEFIPGKNMMDLLDERTHPFPLADVLEWAEQLLKALDYLHREQIIHRDIKPANIKLTADGDVVLLDFGVAKHMSSGSMHAFTPQYAPLEQIHQQGTDLRSDLYSLAATLYHLLTHSPPEGSTTRLLDISRQRPDPLRPPHLLNPQVPPAVSAVLMQALELDQDDRPAQASVMRQRLKEAQKQIHAPTVEPDPALQTIPAFPIGKTRRLSPVGPAPEVEPAVQPPPPPVSTPTGKKKGRHIGMPMLSLLGVVAVVLMLGGLSVKDTLFGTAPTPVARVTPQPVTSASETPLPVRTPVPTNRPTRTPVSTSLPIDIAALPISPTGKIAFQSDRDGNYEIYLMDADGNNGRNLTNNPATDSEPAWSPDGMFIAFSSDRDGNMEIYTMRSDGSEPRNLTLNPAADGDPSWSPDGQWIAFTCERESNFDICVMRADGSELRNLTNDVALDLEPAWSPDGESIAFRSNREGNYEIYVMDADGNDPLNLTQNAAADGEPAWSPDGQWIAWSSDREGNYNIYRMDGSGENPRPLTNSTTDDSKPTWSPDGRFVGFTSRLDSNREISVMDADGQNPRNLTNHPADDLSPAWSPAR